MLFGFHVTIMHFATKPCQIRIILHPRYPPFILLTQMQLIFFQELNKAARAAACRIKYKPKRTLATE